VRTAGRDRPSALGEGAEEKETKCLNERAYPSFP
jgi:hypothetical protein